MSVLIILHGRKSAAPGLREAISLLRDEGHEIAVRTTSEGADFDRLVREGVDIGADRVVAGGGDGTLNEVTNTMLRLGPDDRPPLGILPLGTANDFATACAVPEEPLSALRLALTGKPTPVDAIQVNERGLINVATAGFGAKITAETPVELKSFLGGGAYTLMGLVKVLGFKPYPSGIEAPGRQISDELIVAAVCNGRRAGGGQVLAPDALLDDGQMDVLLVLRFPARDLDTVIGELLDPAVNGQYVKRFRSPWLDSWAEGGMPCNLDGEPYRAERLRFEVLPGAIRMILPPSCPCLSSFHS
jgi:lipid kinase YegS